MSDAQLRDLERRWQQTGTTDDEVALLRARARVGELAAERLRIAAHVGHEAALAVLGERPAAVKPIDEWVSDLELVGGIVALRRAALAADHAALQRAPAGAYEAAFEAWDAARMFTLCPCGPHAPHRRLGGRRAIHDVAWSAGCMNALQDALARAEEPLVRSTVREQVAAWALHQDPLRAGWALPNARLPRAALVELVEQARLQARISGSTGRYRCAATELERALLAPLSRPLVLSPELTPDALIDEALAFEPAAEGTVELQEHLARQPGPRLRTSPDDPGRD